MDCHRQKTFAIKNLQNLGQFYDDIIAQIRDTELIQIFGPGDAKGELEKSLVDEGLKERITKVENVDNMTDNQIAAKVRERFQHQVCQQNKWFCQST